MKKNIFACVIFCCMVYHPQAFTSHHPYLVLAGEEMVNIYPNPVKDTLMVELFNKTHGPLQISLFGPLGEKIKSWHYREQGRVFENSVGQVLGSGVYTVKILRNEAVPLTAKVIIE